MSFSLRPAVRENVPLLIGLAGGTGSGKTLSALLLAKGLSNGKPFAFIDTESGRALAYADDFQFEHGELVAPFRPSTYANAITEIDKLRKYPVIVVDSMSHEYAGDGGVLDFQEEELAGMVKRAKDNNDSRSEYQLQEANKMRSWIRPKMEHKAMMTRLLQVHSHLILCFRAEAKTEMVKKDGKMVIQEKQGLTGLNGWFPITEKNLPYELTAYFLLMAEKPGVPLPIKLMSQHRQFFPLDKPITEEAGRLIGEWAKGGKVNQVVKDSFFTAEVSDQTMLLLKRIEAAPTEAELETLAAECKVASESDRTILREMYAARLTALRSKPTENWI